MDISGTFQAGGTAGARALRRKYAVNIPGLTRKLEWSGLMGEW